MCRYLFALTLWWAMSVSVVTANAEIFHVTNVASLRAALMTAERNGEDDILFIDRRTDGSPVYLLDRRLIYQPTDEDRGIVIAGLPWQKPVFRTSEAAPGMLSIRHHDGRRDGGATVTVADIVCERCTAIDGAAPLSYANSILSLGTRDANVRVVNTAFLDSRISLSPTHDPALPEDLALHDFGATVKIKTRTGRTEVANTIISGSDIGGASAGALAVRSGGRVAIFNNTFVENTSWVGGLIVAHDLPRYELGRIQATIFNNYFAGNADRPHAGDRWPEASKDGAFYITLNGPFGMETPGSCPSFTLARNRINFVLAMVGLPWGPSFRDPDCGTGAGGGGPLTCWCRGSVLIELNYAYPSRPTCDLNADFRPSVDSWHCIDKGFEYDGVRLPSFDYTGHERVAATERSSLPDAVEPAPLPDIGAVEALPAGKGASGGGKAASGRKRVLFVPVRPRTEPPEDLAVIPVPIGDAARNGSNNQQVGWTLSNRRMARSGSVYALHYGSPRTHDYDTARQPNRGRVTVPNIAVPRDGPYALSFDVFLDIDPNPEKDILTVRVGKDVAWTKEMVPTASYGGWHPVLIDLSSHAGNEVDITFEFDTLDGDDNSREGVYVDSLFIGPTKAFEPALPVVTAVPNPTVIKVVE
jgi:hypothetical protein